MATLTTTTQEPTGASIFNSAPATTDPSKAATDPSAKASSSLSGRAAMDWTHWMMIGGSVGGFAGAALSAMISNTIAAAAFGGLGFVSIIGFRIAQTAAEAIQLQDSINHLQQHQAVLSAETKKMESAERSIKNENLALFKKIFDLTEKMKKLETDREELAEAYGLLRKASEGVNTTNTAFGNTLRKFPELLYKLERFVKSSNDQIKESRELSEILHTHVQSVSGLARQSDDLLKKTRGIFDPFTKFTPDKVPESEMVVLNRVAEISEVMSGMLDLAQRNQRGFIHSYSQQCEKADTSVRSMGEMVGQLETTSKALSDMMQQIDGRSGKAQQEHEGLDSLISSLSKVCQNLHKARTELQAQMRAFALDTQKVLTTIGDTAAEADRALNAKAMTLKDLESRLDARQKALAGREIVIQTQNNLFVNWCAPIVDFFLSLRLFGWVR